MLSVQDNGPGLPAHVIERSRDYAVRISDKGFYCSPTRGLLGSALKCCYAAPYVLSGARQSGRVDIATGGVTHRLDVTMNRIRQLPDITWSATPDDCVKTGTKITLYWPEQATYSCITPTPIFTTSIH